MADIQVERRTTLIFFCNGRKVVEEMPDPSMTLLTYLRKTLRLTGTKLGCAEGGCGACTVMVSAVDLETSEISHRAVNACLFPLCAVHGKAVTTVEGLGNTKEKLHPVQERIAKSHGTQCGFCTPGMVMSMYSLLRDQSLPDLEDVITALEGNLCRCTGYRPIIEGYKTFTKNGCCGAQNGFCQNGLENNRQGKSTSVHVFSNRECIQIREDGSFVKEVLQVSSKLYEPEDFIPYDPSQEPIFPPELQISNPVLHGSVMFESKNKRWFRPVSLTELLELKSAYPEGQLLVGNTEVGVDVKFKNKKYPTLIMADSIPELKSCTVSDGGLTVGAAVTLTSLERQLKKLVKDIPEHRTKSFKALVEMLRWFAGRQVRNVATVGGNIVTGSPISDLNPVFMAAGCTLCLTSLDGDRLIPMDPKFYSGYRRTILEKNEVLKSIFIPFTTENEYVLSFKQTQRKEDDIAIVNSGMRVCFAHRTDWVKEVHLAFGGMAETTVMAHKTMEKLKDRRWNEALLEDACTSLRDELALSPGCPGGMEVYRQSLVLSFFFKFFLSVADELHRKTFGKTEVQDRNRSALQVPQSANYEGVQFFQEVPSGQLDSDGVGRPMAHQSALQHATGEAVYVDDMPQLAGELFLAYIFSQRAHAKLISIDKSEALAVPGVHRVITAEDCPDIHVGRTTNDEDLFAVNKVHAVGTVIGAVLATTKEIAQEGARKVKIEYEELEPILTIVDAITKESYFQPTRSVVDGDTSKGLESSDHVIEGEMDVGGQEHFYMETQTSLVVPKEHDEMEIWTSCQWISNMQGMVSKSLNVPFNRISVRTKRIGGAFGGKESRCCIMTSVAAVAARLCDRPVRFMLDRDEDMMSTGGRHPMKTKYKVGFNSDGRIMAMESDFYSNCGFSLDASFAVMARGMFHCDSVYKIPNVRVTGHLCKTNLPSNTAFRGFGIPQIAIVTESWINQIAQICQLTPEVVRERNFYREGDCTHFSQRLVGVTIQKCWDQCLKEFDFTNRRQAVDEFNRKNRWKKRGISVTGTKMGLAIVSALFLNQAGALLNVYEDGSVLLSHSGTEMGQGLHTKIIQIASRCLGIPTSKIHISEASTDKVPNSPPSAASISTDINGMAVKNACQALKSRLEPYIYANPKGTWDDWVRAAYIDRVSLSVTGFHKIEDLHYDWEKNSGRPYDYFSFGAAASEVEIDCLTGGHQVIKTHIVMDVGDSLNPAIDVGQIEGGFIQGYGLFVLEDHHITPKGHLITKGPGTYKIPSISNIPGQFSVSLLSNVPNPRTIFSSKGVGEPSLILATSVFLAIKDAIQSARSESDLTGFFRLDSPATSERIRLACEDNFTKKFKQPEPGSYEPFFIRP